MTRNYNLAKLLAPALLLSATLALPAQSADAVPISKAAKASEAKVEKQKKQKKVVKVDKKAAKKQVVKTQTKAVKVTKVKTAPARQTIVVRPAAPRVVYAQPTTVYRTAAPYRPSAGENSPLFLITGVITDEGRRCLAMRDRRGKLYTLVGKVEGLEVGDDIEVMVRRVLPVYARECSQGDTVRVGQVRTIWSDSSRRYAIYDSRSDGTFDPYQRDRYERDYRSRYDDRYRDDRYRDGRYRDDRYRDGRYRDDRDRYDSRYGDRSDDDRYYDNDTGRDYRDENGRLISVTGRLGGTSSCAMLRDRDGRIFGLSGDLRSYDPGDTVRVIGFLQGGYRCGGANIDVQEITRP
jgi:hypothetical protein